MTTAVVSAPENQQNFLTQNFAGPILDVAVGGGKVYLLHRVNRRDADLSFTDPIDGALLVECAYSGPS